MIKWTLVGFVFSVYRGLVDRGFTFLSFYFFYEILSMIWPRFEVFSPRVSPCLLQCRHTSWITDIVFSAADYNLLEEVKSAAESAQRTRNKLCGYSHFKLPFHLRGLKNASGSRRTKLLFLPSGMSKRSRNQSRYDPRLETTNVCTTSFFCLEVDYNGFLPWENPAIIMLWF